MMMTIFDFKSSGKSTAANKTVYMRVDLRLKIFL